MKQQKNNSKLIFALSILWGLLLISLQFMYFMGRTDELVDTWDVMSSYVPIAISILIMNGVAGRSLAKAQIKVNLTKRYFILIASLCLLFFPIGLFFLFGTKKYKELER